MVITVKQLVSLTILLLLLLLLLTSGLWRGPQSGVSAAQEQSSSPTGPVCNGVFDLYFVLDSSGSVGNNYRSNIVPFVEQLITHYAESGFRIAIVTFDARSTIRLRLTPIANKVAVQTALNNLKTVNLGVATMLSPALIQVNSMISSASGSHEVTSIILIVTDGGLGDASSAQSQAQIARNRGSPIFAIGVGSYNYQQLLGLTDYSDRVFTRSDFSVLHQILDNVVEEICIEITPPNATIHVIAPMKYCRGRQTPTINISGSGFETLNHPTCHFWTQTSGRRLVSYDKEPVINTSFSSLLCPTPRTGQLTGDIYLQVMTRNGYNLTKNETLKFFIEDCRRLSEAHPNQWCIFETVERVNISGNALTDGLDPQSVYCKYTLETGEEYKTYPVNVTDNEVYCPTSSPNENFTLSGVVEVKVSLNGTDYVPNSLFVRIDNCSRLNIALIAGIVGGVLGLLALLALCCLLWCLLPLITCTVVGGVVQKDEEPVLVSAPPPPPTPPPPADVPRKPGRKWTIVDASYYGIRGAGGIRPARVQWGSKGTTEEGAKLKRAKDAVKLGEVQVQGPPASPTRGTGMTSALLMEEDGGEGDRKLCCCVLCCRLCYRRCCGVIVNKLKGCYTVIASYRPVFKYHGTLGKRVLCCPGPNADKKLKENGITQQTKTTNGRVPTPGSTPQPKWRLPQTKTSEVQEPLLLT